MHNMIDPREPEPARPGGPADTGFLEAVFASMGTGVCVVDADGVVIACNPLAEELLDHPSGALLGRALHRAVCLSGPEGHGPQDGRGDGPGDGSRSGRPDPDCPLLRAARTGEPTAEDDDVFVRRDGSRLPVVWTSSPLRHGGRITGAVVVFRDATVRRRKRARRAAQYARGQEARRQAEDAHATLALLAQLTDALVSTLDAHKGLEELARLLVPSFADWAALDVAAGPGRIRRVTWPRAKGATESGGTLSPRFAPNSRAPLARVLAGAGTRLMTGPAAAAGPGRRAFDAWQRELFAELGASSTLMVPMRHRGTTLGAMTLVRTDPAWPFTDDEVLLAEEVARRAALSVDNARMYGQQADISAVLQRSLLTELPHLEDLELAASYRPAHQEAEIGGDWYDAFVLPDGDLAVVVGDVVGHDLEAASHMGALRNMLRALAVDRASTPGDLLQRLDAAMEHLDVADSATAVCGFLRPASAGHWHFTWSNAGHPPPLLLTPDGGARWMEDGHDLLLGVEPGQARPTATTVLAPGATVLLYTDGLVESRTRPIDSGLDRLRRRAAAEAHLPPEDLCTNLIKSLGDPTDDITVIAVRIPSAGTTGQPAPRGEPGEPGQAGATGPVV